MKKLFYLVLCFVLVAGSAQAGAGGNSAKQDDNNLRRAGKSSIFFYDVESTSTHGFGKLVIDMNKHTFSFIGQDFPPSQHIDLKTKTGEDFAVFAREKSTPSGNLHITGTWESDELPSEVVGEVYYIYPPANGFSLSNYGGFMAHLTVYYTTDTEWASPVEPTWHEATLMTDGFGLNNTRQVNLADLSIPEGAWVRIHAIVVSGKDRTGSEYYTFANGICYIPGYCYPHYYIDRTAWNPILTYGRTDCYCAPIQSSDLVDNKYD